MCFLFAQASLVSARRLLSSRSVQASYCSGCSWGGAQALARGLQSRGSQALERGLSRVVPPPLGRGNLPGAGIEPVFPALAGGLINDWTAMEAHYVLNESPLVDFLHLYPLKAAVM